MPTFPLHWQLAGSKGPGPDVHKMKPTAALLTFKMEMGGRDARAVHPARPLHVPRFIAQAKRREVSMASLDESCPLSQRALLAASGEGFWPELAPS